MSFINKAIEKNIPLAAQLNLTNRCNLKCIHCYVSRPDPKNGYRRYSGQRGNCLKTDIPVLQRPSNGKIHKKTLMSHLLTKSNENAQLRFSDELDKDEILQLIQDLATEGCLFLTLSGGEIFLRDDLFEIIGYAKQHGFALKIFTNGTLIDQNASKVSLGMK